MLIVVRKSTVHVKYITIPRLELTSVIVAVNTAVAERR